MYVKNGVQQSISEDSFVIATATCNDNNIPLSGGYSMVGEMKRGNDKGENNEIGRIPNIQNNSWTINVEGGKCSNNSFCSMSNY